MRSARVPTVLSGAINHFHPKEDFDAASLRIAEHEDVAARGILIEQRLHENAKFVESGTQVGGTGGQIYFGGGPRCQHEA